jgi:hypothetical protein
VSRSPPSADKRHENIFHTRADGVTKEERSFLMSETQTCHQDAKFPSTLSDLVYLRMFSLILQEASKTRRSEMPRAPALSRGPSVPSAAGCVSFLRVSGVASICQIVFINNTAAQSKSQSEMMAWGRVKKWAGFPS